LTATRISIVNRKSQVKLLGGLDDSNTAIFLEQQLERWLKIEDHPVPGEIPRCIRGNGIRGDHFSNYEITHPIPLI
jgi:hypothetical protein